MGMAMIDKRHSGTYMVSSSSLDSVPSASASASANLTATLRS